MCEPTTLLTASLAINAATAGLSYISGASQARQQQRAINDAASMRQMDLTRQQEQQWTAGAGEANDFAKQAAKDAALFDAITGEYGGGNTANRLATVQSVTANEKLATIGYNSRLAASETGFRSQATRQNAQSSLDSIVRPSMAGAAITIGSAAIDYQTGMNKLRKGPLNG